MPRIFIPLASGAIPTGSTTPVYFARETYVRKLLIRGLVPVFVSPITPPDMLREIYDSCSGVLLMGGADVDPARYGAAMHPKTALDSPKRDEIEVTVSRWALTEKKPILGICRGCQVLAVASGGTLVQDLPEAVPQEYHGLSEGGNYDNLHDSGNGHAVRLETDSAIARLIGKTDIRVKTGHHQAVDTPGEGLRISGRSPAGVAEVIESTDPEVFCFGIQSHPESEDHGDLEPVVFCFGIQSHPESEDHGDLEPVFDAFSSAAARA